MDFLSFLNEKNIVELLKDLNPNLDSKDFMSKLKKAATDNKIEIFKNNIFIGVDKGNKLGGYFIYTLNEPSEKYKTDTEDESEENYFYIGKFVFDISTNKVEEIIESTTDRFDTPIKAKNKIIVEYKASQM